MLIPDVGRRTDRYAEERWLYAEPRPQLKNQLRTWHSGRRMTIRHASGEAKHCVDVTPAMGISKVGYAYGSRQRHRSVVGNSAW